MINAELYYKNCTLCPRKCGVDRTEGKVGYCRCSSDMTVARASLHHWEEPCISGTCGSGTVFFSGCSLKCVYCQNYRISINEYGIFVSEKRLSEIFLELQDKGAANINLVTSAHFTPSVINALDIAMERGLSLPIVYNSSGYESKGTIEMLSGYIDIYLPDMKYVSQTLSQKYSGASDYFEVAKKALAEMVSQQPIPVFGDDGMMKKGVIVRHLLLPECSYDSKKVLKYLHETYGNSIFISVMRQYTPGANVKESYPELDRKISDSEYFRILDYCDKIGIENGFSQEAESAEESFIPPFDLSGVEKNGIEKGD